MGSPTLDSTQRRRLLAEVASGERAIAYDVVARIALDEINELDKLLTLAHAQLLPIKKGS